MADVRQLLPALANDFRRWWPAEYWEASARKNCSQPLPGGATGREALGRGKACRGAGAGVRLLPRHGKGRGAGDSDELVESTSGAEALGRARPGPGRGKGRSASGSAAPVDLAGGVAREKLRRRREHLVKQLVDVEQKSSPHRRAPVRQLPSPI